MGIVSTKIIRQTTQADGAQRTQVDFIDRLGKSHRRSFDFPAGADVAKQIELRKSNIEYGLAQRDIEQAVSRIEQGKSFKLDYASEADLKIRLQEYEAFKQEEIDRLSSEKINLSTKVAKL